MARSLRLRKCSQHPDCQLQKINDGDWEHTPAKQRLRDRFVSHDALTKQLQQELERVDDLRRLLGDIGRESSHALSRVQDGLPDLKALKREVQEELVRAGELSRILTELGGRMGTVLAEFKIETANLPKTLDLQAKADRAREYLDSRLKIAQRALERLERASEKADSDADSRSDRMRVIQTEERRIMQAGTRADEALRSAMSKLSQADSLMTALLESQSTLQRVDSLHTAFKQLSDDVQTRVKALEANDKETRRLISHEREERLESVAKAAKGVQSHIKESHGG